jgi:hypothetical protein
MGCWPLKGWNVPSPFDYEIVTVRLVLNSLYISSCLGSLTNMWNMNYASLNSFVRYGCETWSLTLREEHRLRVFENSVLRRIFGPKREEVGSWRKLHDD